MKRVLFVDHVDRILGGAEINLIELIEEAQKHGEWEVAVACRAGSKLSKSLNALHVRQFDYGFSEAVNTLRFVGRAFPWSGIVRGMRAIKQAGRDLGKICGQFTPHTLVSCTNKDHFASIYACAEDKTKSIWWINDLLTADFFPFAARAAFRRMAKRTAHLVAVSNCVAEALDQLGVPSKKIRLIRNGIPVAKYQRRECGAFRHRLGIPQDQPLFGTIGRICEWKGQDRFLTMAQFFIALDGPGHFVVVGKAFNEDAEFEKRIRDLAIQPVVRFDPPINAQELHKRIHFVSFQDDVSEVLADLHVLFHMSQKPEPFGRVIVEAMAAGVPVVASKAGGPAELIQHEVNGFLANTTVEFNDWLGLIQQGHVDIENVKANARATVEKHFTIERVYREFNELFSSFSSSST